MPQYCIGTSAWTDTGLIASGVFYPPTARTAEDRLRFYAAHFNTVEVDSTYYALPAERNAHIWVERTPANFLFHIKAFALLTQHQAEVSRLPKVLKDALPQGYLREARLRHPPPEVLDLTFHMFGSALAPLKAAGKLGILLFQFPPWFQAKKENYDYILYCQEKLSEYQLAIEFRHVSWFVGRKQEETLTFLRHHRLVYVCVDEPPSPLTVPSLCTATTDEAYVRFHGRNLIGWFTKGAPVREKFRYLYDREDLTAWAEKIRRLRDVRTVTVIFNNCFEDYAVRNAQMLREILAGLEDRLCGAPAH